MSQWQNIEARVDEFESAFDGAVELYQYSGHRIPGPYQTSEYMDAVLGMAGVERLPRHNDRLTRLDRMTPGAVVDVIASEAVLTRVPEVVGGAEIMRGALRHFAEMAQARGGVRIMPSNAPELGTFDYAITGSFEDGRIVRRLWQPDISPTKGDVTVEPEIVDQVWGLHHKLGRAALSPQASVERILQIAEKL